MQATDEAITTETCDGATPRVRALVPSYNAGPHLWRVAQALCAQGTEVLVVDDGSTDGSIAPLGALPVEVETLPRNRGKGHAILAGLRAALADPTLDAVVVLDADGQHEPRALPDFVRCFRETRADLVMGVRELGGPGVPLRSRVGNAITAQAVRLLFGVRLPDTQCGYRLLSRAFMEEVVARVPGGRYDTEMEMLVRALRGPWRVETVSIATLYEAGNPTSHFRKVSDSLSIYGRLLRAWWRR